MQHLSNPVDIKQILLDIIESYNYIVTQDNYLGNIKDLRDIKIAFLSHIKLLHISSQDFSEIKKLQEELNKKAPDNSDMTLLLNNAIEALEEAKELQLKAEKSKKEMRKLKQQRFFYTPMKSQKI